MYTSDCLTCSYTHPSSDLIWPLCTPVTVWHAHTHTHSVAWSDLCVHQCLFDMLIHTPIQWLDLTSVYTSVCLTCSYTHPSSDLIWPLCTPVFVWHAHTHTHPVTWSDLCVHQCLFDMLIHTPIQWLDLTSVYTSVYLTCSYTPIQWLDLTSVYTSVCLTCSYTHPSSDLIWPLCTPVIIWHAHTHTHPVTWSDLCVHQWLFDMLIHTPIQWLDLTSVYTSVYLTCSYTHPSSDLIWPLCTPVIIWHAHTHPSSDLIWPLCTPVFIWHAHTHTHPVTWSDRCVHQWLFDMLIHTPIQWLDLTSVYTSVCLTCSYTHPSSDLIWPLCTPVFVWHAHTHTHPVTWSDLCVHQCLFDMLIHTPIQWLDLTSVYTSVYLTCSYTHPSSDLIWPLCTPMIVWHAHTHTHPVTWSDLCVHQWLFDMLIHTPIQWLDLTSVYTSVYLTCSYTHPSSDLIWPLCTPVFIWHAHTHPSSGLIWPLCTPVFVWHALTHTHPVAWSDLCVHQWLFDMLLHTSIQWLDLTSVYTSVYLTCSYTHPSSDLIWPLCTPVFIWHAHTHTHPVTWSDLCVHQCLFDMLLHTSIQWLDLTSVYTSVYLTCSYTHPSSGLIWPLCTPVFVWHALTHIHPVTWSDLCVHQCLFDMLIHTPIQWLDLTSVYTSVCLTCSYTHPSSGLIWPLCTPVFVWHAHTHPSSGLIWPLCTPVFIWHAHTHTHPVAWSDLCVHQCLFDMLIRHPSSGLIWPLWYTSVYLTCSYTPIQWLDLTSVYTSVYLTCSYTPIQWLDLTSVYTSVCLTCSYTHPSSGLIWPLCTPVFIWHAHTHTHPVAWSDVCVHQWLFDMLIHTPIQWLDLTSVYTSVYLTCSYTHPSSDLIWTLCTPVICLTCSYTHPSSDLIWPLCTPVFVWHAHTHTHPVTWSDLCVHQCLFDMLIHTPIQWLDLTSVYTSVCLTCSQQEHTKTQALVQDLQTLMAATRYEDTYGPRPLFGYDITSGSHVVKLPPPCRLCVWGRLTFLLVLDFCFLFLPITILALLSPPAVSFPLCLPLSLPSHLLVYLWIVPCCCHSLISPSNLQAVNLIGQS